MGTHVMVEHNGRRVVVIVNDVGPGGEDKHNVLDLSHAAAASLLGKTIDQITPLQTGVIKLDKITVVPDYIRVGPGP